MDFYRHKFPAHLRWTAFHKIEIDSNRTFARVAAVRLLKLAVNQESLRTEDNKDNQKFSFNHRSLLPSFPSVKVERCPLTVILQLSPTVRLGPT
jgi:hypothetical protein